MFLAEIIDEQNKICGGNIMTDPYQPKKDALRCIDDLKRDLKFMKIEADRHCLNDLIQKIKQHKPHDPMAVLLKRLKKNEEKKLKNV